MAVWSVLRHRYKLSFFLSLFFFRDPSWNHDSPRPMKKIWCVPDGPHDPPLFFELLRCRSDVIHKRSEAHEGPLLRPNVTDGRSDRTRLDAREILI